MKVREEWQQTPVNSKITPHHSIKKEFKKVCLQVTVYLWSVIPNILNLPHQARGYPTAFVSFYQQLLWNYYCFFLLSMYRILVFLSITSTYTISPSPSPTHLSSRTAAGAGAASIKAIISITRGEKVSSHKRCIHPVRTNRYDGDDEAMLLLLFLVDYDDWLTKEDEGESFILLVNNKDIEVGWVWMESRTKKNKRTD